MFASQDVSKRYGSSLEIPTLEVSTVREARGSFDSLAIADECKLSRVTERRGNGRRICYHSVNSGTRMPVCKKTLGVIQCKNE